MATFSFSLAGSSKARKVSSPPPQNGVKRVHALLGDDDSDEEDVVTGKHQDVTHFDLTAGGAVDVNKPKVVKEPLVIKRQANRDWKEASQRKRQKDGLPSEDQVSAQEYDGPRGPEAIYGLDVRKRNAEHIQEAGDAPNVDAPDDAQPEVVPTRPKTDEELALDALMGRKQQSTLTIPAVTKEEAFERDYQDAPDVPTLDQYTATPVEEFGAAMLRGMGWKEGQGIGNQRGKKIVKAKVLERRPALLGIGAKPDAAVAAELGAWGQGAKGKKKVDITYNPLVLRNAKTGEQLTEDELQAKMQKQKERDTDWEHARESDRNREREEKSSKRHHQDDYVPDDGKRKDERRRELDYKNDRHDDRRSGRRDDKHRSTRRDRSASYDRYRSRRDRSTSYDRARDKRRDRDYDDRRGKEDRREKDGRRKERGDNDKERNKRYDDDRDRDSRRHRR